MDQVRTLEEEASGGPIYLETVLPRPVGSSETSINQPAPPSPEPVAPEVDRGGPFIPEDENGNHLMPAQERMEELGHRLGPEKKTGAGQASLQHRLQWRKG